MMLSIDRFTKINFLSNGHTSLVNSNILYILGGGHSGSTLLDLIISSANEVFSVGELAFLDQYIGSTPASYKLTKGRICTCGEFIDNCPFWQSTGISFENNIVKIESFRESLKFLFNILNPFEHYFRFSIRIGDNKRVYEKIAAAAGNIKPDLNYILDSSKDPRRLYELIADKSIPNRNIWVIHLVRDGRGYINSYQYIKRKQQGLKVRSTLYYLIEWLLINSISRMMIKKYRINAIHISYDMFCRSPETYISRINHWLGISIVDYLEEMNQTPRHNIHGNLMRFSKIDSIVHDRSWQKGMGSIKKGILSFILFPFNKRWVYHK